MNLHTATSTQQVNVINVQLRTLHAICATLLTFRTKIMLHYVFTSFCAKTTSKKTFHRVIGPLLAIPLLNAADKQAMTQYLSSRCIITVLDLNACKYFCEPQMLGRAARQKLIGASKQTNSFSSMSFVIHVYQASLRLR